MQIKIAKHAGTCFGVDNAINIAFEGAKRTNGNQTYILGDLVHNPQIVKQLNELGVSTIKDVMELKTDDNLIIRAHGEPEHVYTYCKNNNVNIIDCTCPFVRRVQIMAKQLQEMDYKVVLVGDKDHPEVRGIAAKAKDAIVISKASEITNELREHSKLGIISQTTQNTQNFKEIVSRLNEPGKQLEVHNTICSATTNRQNSALKLCDEVNKMIVIGGKNSANTKRLYELCKEKVDTYWITSADELKGQWFNKKDTVGITAGASTPTGIFEQVNHALSEGKIFK